MDTYGSVDLNDPNFIDLSIPPPRRLILDDIDLTPPLSPEELAEFNSLAAQLIEIPWCPWKPNPGPQTMFLLDFGRESLYGGAAGGGKSIAIMMAASQYLHVPGYAALLLRKSYGDLGKPGALMDIADDWWGEHRGHGVKFDAAQHTYYFDCPGGGRSKIVFGALDNENDRFKYQGGAYHFIGWDELTQQKERDYRYLFSRQRRVKDGPLSLLPVRTRATTNPGGIGHDWVYKRFIVGWEAWRRGLADRPVRNFHPAILKDNPKLDIEDYRASMAELDPITRAQLERGDWNIRPDGRMFKRRWFKSISRQDVPPNCRWVRFWDMASTEPSPGTEPDYTVGALVGRSPDGRYFIVDVRRWRHEAGTNDLMCKATGLFDTNRVIEVMEQEPGASGKIAIHHYRTQVFENMNFRGVPASGKGAGRTSVAAGRKTGRAKIVAAGPVAAHADAGSVFVVTDGSFDVEELIGEFEIFPDGLHDDQVDAVAGAFSVLAKLHIGALTFDVNVELEQENGWIPDALPKFTEMDVLAGDGWAGERLAETRAMTEQEIRAGVANAWAM